MTSGKVITDTSRGTAKDWRRTGVDLEQSFRRMKERNENAVQRKGKRLEMVRKAEGADVTRDLFITPNTPKLVLRLHKLLHITTNTTDNINYLTSNIRIELQ